MSTSELVLNMLAETAAKEFSQAEKPKSFGDNVAVAKRGGKVAGEARRAIESGTGRSLITNKTARELNHVVTQMIDASVSMSEEQNGGEDEE